MDSIISILLSIPAMLISLTVHEAAHGWISYKLGDPTARDLGRVSFNPLRHLDPIGALSLVLFRVGWAKPVPINPRNFKKPIQGMALTALAGPISNFIMAILSLIPFLLLHHFSPSWNLPTFFASFLGFLFEFLSICILMNLMLGIFNLIPLPPLDGSRILAAFLPPKARFWLIENERKLYIITLVWMIAGSYVSTFLLSINQIASNPILSTLVKFLSVTGWVRDLAYLLADLLIRLFTYIPFLA